MPRTPLFALLVLCVSTFPALAQQTPQYGAPGEMDAVMARCGKPKGISKGISPVTNTLQRNLIYSDTLILHFQPIQNGWAFTTGWDGHVPVTRDQLQIKMPCFRQALADAARAPVTKVTTDPTIAQQTASTPFDNTNFGIPHLYLILGLVGIFLLCIFIPTRKRKQKRQLEAAEKVYRNPEVQTHIPPRKHIDSDLYQEPPRHQDPPRKNP